MQKLLRLQVRMLRYMRLDRIKRSKPEVCSARQTIHRELEHGENRVEIKCAEQFNIEDWTAFNWTQLLEQAQRAADLRHAGGFQRLCNRLPLQFREAP